MIEAQFIVEASEVMRELDLNEVKNVIALNEVIEASSEEIEAYLNRKLVTRGTITEYHEPTIADSELFLRRWPIIAVTSVHETSSATYDATTLLTANTDYIVYTDAGKLLRTSSGDSKRTWKTGGLEPIKVIYTAGYATQATIPQDIKKVCRELAVMKYREIVDRSQGQLSRNDDMGNVRYFGPPMLTNGMKRRLDRYADRTVFGGHTWTRSEAA